MKNYKNCLIFHNNELNKNISKPRVIICSFDSSNLFFLVTSNTRLISMFSHEIEGIFRNTKS